MLEVGTRAPDLRLPDQHGRLVDLSGFHGAKNVVLFFYPMADTRVCTLEACAFRDALPDLDARDFVVVGISRDGMEAQQAFAERWSLPFSLLSDAHGKARRAYRVDRFFGLLPGRVTYVIDREGIIRAAYRNLFEAEGHVSQALKALGDQGSR
ncbi:MAG: peroxiredoxin [Flavobacteriales bacterium]|nr:peroxiredoxin [Flavobacteriales bacterium]